LNVAVMGCAVNGPGEAKGADFGIAGGDGFCVFFKNGELICRVDEDKAVDFLFDETVKAINGSD
ncbi:MAG: flavodoxin-dependent (E)-4-hydroxy-3-methylbut-2-enyl-diphosphate synthase, partial [Eubacteriales bacterium]